MKLKFPSAAAIVVFTMTVTASADVIYSNYLNTTIPLDFTGVTINVGSGSLNPFFGGVGVANNANLQPFRDGTGGLDTILNFTFGDTIDSSDLYLASGNGGSSDHVGGGGTFTAGTEGYVGFKLNGTNYGWMRVVFTNNTGGAVVKDWAYDNSGAAISVGGIRQVGSDYVLSSGFAVGSAISNAGGTTNLLKNSTGSTTTLKAVNTYTGTTSVTAGTLAVTGSGSINTTSSISVSAGAKFIYSSSTALTVAPTLNGSGTSNRAVLGGTGTINTGVTLNDLGDTLSPGADAPGVLSFSANQTWDSFAYDWEINDWTSSVAGTDIDQLGITGTLNLASTSADTYLLNILSLIDPSNSPGNVTNFTEIGKSWTILTTTGGITGFDASEWDIDATGFTNPEGGTWSLGLGNSGNDLILTYTVPEPSAAMLLGLGTLALLRRRRPAH